MWMDDNKGVAKIREEELASREEEEASRSVAQLQEVSSRKS
jgi:hypothetical protein